MTESINGAPLRISQEANGFLVRPLQTNYPPEASYVFQTFAELTVFLGQHFSHRTQRLFVDTLPPPHISS